MKELLEERTDAFQAGEWTIEPDLNALRRNGVEHHVEPKVMKVLLALAARQNHVVTKEELIRTVWPETFVSDDVLTRCVSILRKITQDDPHAPRFIQTVPKVGYRLVAPVGQVAREITAVPQVAAQGEDAVVIVEPREAAVLAGAMAEAVALGATRSEGARGRWWLGGVAVVVVLVAATMVVLGLRERRRAAGSRALLRTVSFTSDAGEQTQPAFAPDGRAIAYVATSEDGAERRIYVKRIGEEMARPLNGEGGRQYSPVWSPDGRQIAYLARTEGGLGVWVAGVAGGGARRVAIPQEPSHWDQGALAWSPDGRMLLFPDHRGTEANSSIYELELATGRTRSITTPPAGWEGDLSPAYSPDGRRIAFTRASETSVREIYWMAVGDGRVHALTHDGRSIDSLAWASATTIVFSSNRGGKYALWRIGVEDGSPERSPVGTEDAFEPAMGGRGQLAYTQGSAIWGILRVRGGGAGEAAGSTAEAVLQSTQQDSAPAISPDGRWFAMQSLRSSSQEIWIATAGGDRLRQVTAMRGPVTGSPAWSHRGDALVFDSRPDGHSHIFRVAAAAGGAPKQLTFGEANDIVPRWAHDDQTVLFRSNRGGRWQLWRMPAAGGTPQPVTTGDGMEPQESADGRWLYFSRGDEAGVWRVPVAGGAEERVLTQPAAGYWGYWELTGRDLFYLDLNQGAAAIRVKDLETGMVGTFAVLERRPPLYAGLSVMADGREVLMTDEREPGRHITLVEPE